MVQGAYITGQFMRNWIFHVPGSTYEAPANLKALTTFQQWFKDGYFGKNYNALGENDASAAFAKGKGVFYLGGNWQAAVIQGGLKDNAGFMDMPPGPSGKYVAIGATSLPWHISAKSKYPDVGAAFINWLDPAPGSAKLMYAQNQIPAVPTHRRRRATLPHLGRRRLAAARQEQRPDALPGLGVDQHADRDGHRVPEDDRPAPDAGADTAKTIQNEWATFDKTLK